MKPSNLLAATALSGTFLLLPAAALASTPGATAAAPVATQQAIPAQGTQTGTAADSSTSSLAPAPQSQDANPATGDVVVTGSRIATSPNATSIVPVTSIGVGELTQNSRTSIGDTLNDLPQLTSTFSQSNSTRFLGTAGLNLLNLRGLGTQRTLVLVNGRRHVGSDILNNAVSPDTNTFPTDLIERVDIVTGGSSAVYGSDAIAGVVNFVLKDHFDGLQLRGQGGVSQYGDAGSYYASALAGKNFADDRGNVAVDLEYAHQSSFFASDRPYLRRNNTFLTVETDAPGLPNNSDGIPDAVFYRDIRSATIYSGGLFAASGGVGGACGKDYLGRPFTCNYIFNTDGTLTPQTGTRVGLSGGTAAAPSATPSGSFIGGNGNTRREGQLLQVQPQLDRYAANIVGHFTISDAFVPFVEAKYVRTDSFGTGSSGPAFITGTTLAGYSTPTGVAGTSTGSYERPALSNPFLSAQARGVITQALITGGTAPGAITDATRFSLRENLVGLGVRNERARRETYRIVGGLKGTFNEGWNYELSANYGEFDERTKVLGNLNVQRFLLAMDAQRNATGQIVCGSQISALRAGTDLNGNAANLANDIAACQPLNPFGENSISQAAKNYVLQDTTSAGKITQFDALATMSGDTHQFLTLPGGPIAFSLGGEYRRETAFFQEDPLVRNGYTFYNAIPTFNPPAFEVKEGFAEIRLPVLKDFTLAKELTITAAARVSGYNSNAGTVKTYNFGGVYAPIPDIKFRAGYARAIRAPNLSDLYSQQSQNFAPGFSDPCSARNLANGTQYRAANCAASGIPNSYDFVYAQSLQILSGGNPNLNVETSDSYTYGVILQPRFIPGLTLSADYYNIKVNNVITAPSAQGIVNSCYDSPTTANQFCALFRRVAAGQTGPQGEQSYRIIEGSLQQTLLNYAKLQVRGIDVDLAYTHNFGNVRLESHVEYTHQLQNDSFTDPTQPGFADTTLGELGQPRDAANWSVRADFGPVYASYQVRYLSKMAVGAIENHITFQGRPPQNLDDFDIPYYPDIFYLDARFGFNITKGSNFYVGVDNLTNRIPPLGATGIGAGSGIFETVGRRFYAGVTAKF